MSTVQQLNANLHRKAVFTRAYLYRVHASHTCTRYMLQLCLHVRTCIAYMFRVHVRKTGTQYNVFSMFYTCIHVCDTCTQYRYVRINTVQVVAFIRIREHQLSGNALYSLIRGSYSTALRRTRLYISTHMIHKMRYNG